MVEIKCRNKECGVSIDSEKPTPEDQLNWWLSDNGKVQWNCMECEEEWEGGFLG